MSKSVLIIGAGIGGLGAATLLAASGYDVTIVEQHDTVGGRAGLLEKDGFRFDTGPSWYLMPTVFEHYFDLLGETTQDLQLQKLSPAYKIFFENADPLTVTSDLQTDSKTFENIEAGSGVALQKYVKNSQNLYELSLRHFLYTNFERMRDLAHPDILRSMWRLPRMLLTSIDSYISTYVRDQRLKQILEYPMVFLGTSPYTAPALYSLMSALDFNEGVFYPKNGMYSIIEKMERLALQHGVVIKTGASVENIDITEGIATVVTLSDGSQLKADVVISNADLHDTETRLVEKQYQSFPESYWSTREAGPSALLLYLGVKDALPEFQHHNLLFVDAWRENFDAMYKTKHVPEKASIYISKTSATDPSAAPEGHENVFVLIPLPAANVSRADCDQLIERYMRQVTDMTGVDLLQRSVTKDVFYPDMFGEKFASWQSSMLGQSHLLKQSAFFRTPNKSRKVKNLYYVGGSTVPGIGLPMCLIGAELVYKRVLGIKASGPLAKLEAKK
jgi:phytoene desaturase